MAEYGPARRVWRALYPMLLYLAITFAVTFLAVFAYALVYMLSNPEILTDYNAIESIMNDILSPIIENSLPIALVGYIVALIVFFFIWRRTKPRYPRWNGGGIRIVPALCAVGAAVFFNTVLSIVLGLTGVMEYFESYESVTELITSGGFLIQLLAVGIVGPVAEELCFRGITLSRLSTTKNRWVAIAIQAALFGIVHLNVLQGAYAALLGVFLGLIVIRYRSVIYGIIGHIAFNTYTVVLGQLEDAPEYVYSIILLVTIAAGIASIIGFIKCKAPAPYAVEPVAATAAPSADEPVW